MSLDRATIVTLGSALPPAIGIFGRLEELLQRPETDLDQIVALVRIDSALTFQIIRLGSSVFYGLKSRCESLEDAVARIGFGDIHSLVGLVAARHACQNDLKAYGVPSRRVWENSIATGQLMAAFAARNGVDVRNAYSTGLLRNLGRMVLNNYAGAVRYPGVSTARDITAWELATYQISSAEVGAMLLEHWRFSPDTIAAVRGHFNPISASGSALPAAMLHLSAAVAEGWGLGMPGESCLWHEDVAMLNRSGLTEDSAKEAIAEAQQRFTKVVALKWETAP